MVPWKVNKLKVLPGHRLEVAFADGLSGVIDLSKDHFDGVLAPSGGDDLKGIIVLPASHASNFMSGTIIPVDSSAVAW